MIAACCRVLKPALVVVAAAAVGACRPPATQRAEVAGPSIESRPPVLTTLHVPLDRVARISRFRSGVGHDYSDGVERCRSMKHYFAFRNADGSAGEPGRPHDPPWTTVPVVAPLAGVVVAVQAEWAGDQVRIRSAVDPRVTVVLFHVRRATGVDVGAALAAGQAVGRHASDETMSDIAVEVADGAAPQGRRLVSAFDPAVMGDAAFAALAAWGVGARADLIIGRAERDAAPLRCDGERFVAGVEAGAAVGAGMGEGTVQGPKQGSKHGPLQEPMQGPADWVVLPGP